MESSLSSGEDVPGLIDVFVGLLESHAENVLAQNETNLPYCEQVRSRAARVRDILDGASGEVRGLVSAWTTDMGPIVEMLFGVDLEGHRIGDNVEYSPTIFAGVEARVRMLSSDEMLGPTLSLDIVRVEDGLQ